MKSIETSRIGVVAAYAGMCAIWGTTWLVIKVNLHSFTPLVGVGLRFVIAGLFLYAVAALRGELRPMRELPWKLILVLSAFMFGLNYIFTYTAEVRLDSGLVAVLFGVLPFFVFAFGHFLADERTTTRIWVGAAIAFGGVAVVSLGSQIQGSPWFALAAVGAAVSSAFANVYAKRHSHHPPLVTLPPAMLFAGLVVGTLGLITERNDWTHALATPAIASLLYLALLGSSLAFLLNLWVIARIAVWIVGLSSLIIPVMAVTVGILIGGEHFTLRELAGSAIVIGGIWFALAGQTPNTTSAKSGADRA